MNEREQLAKDNGMTIEFVNWFFDNKKGGCGNAWFIMMAAMWEGWSGREAKCAALAAEVQAVRWACGQVYMKGYNHGHLNTVDGLDYASDTELVERGGEALADFTDPDHCGVAADAILAEVRAQGVKSLSNAVQSVISERQRQQSVEGWTPEHDDEHTEGEMAEAAACYAMFANNQGFSVPGLWPWAREWWKQSGQRRDLVKAGALILAEIERIDRQESAQ